MPPSRLGLAAHWRSARPFARLTGLLVLVTILTEAGRRAVGAVAAQTTLAAAPNPYVIPAHALELYLLVPLASLAGCAFLLAPGLLVALATARRGEDFGYWVLKGFAIGLVLVTAWMATLQALLGGAVLAGAGFFWSIALLNLVALGLVWRRDQRANEQATSIDGPTGVDWTMFSGRRADLLLMILAPLATLVLLSPKFYWENFNGDGAHALQAARLIIFRAAPIWPAGAGQVGNYPSFQGLTPSLPISWLVRLYGESEYAVRMSYLLGLPVAAAMILALIRQGAADRPGASDRRATTAWTALGVGIVLLCYGFCLAYNTSYDPYFADIALPLAREPIVLVTFLGFAMAYLRREYGWLLGFALLTFLTGPGGPVLMGAWLAGAWLTLSPRPWQRSFAGGVAVVLAIVICTVMPALLVRAGLGVASTEFDSGGILQRLRYVTLDDWQRWLFWLLPAGIIPVGALLWWKPQDQLARAFTVMSAIYFGFFYVQAYRILPHHFTPIMLTPLIVMWRLDPVQRRPRLAVAASAAGALLAMVLSAPAVWRPHQEGSRLGSSILIEHSNYARFDPGELGRMHTILWQAFPMQRSEGAAEQHYLGSPIPWYTYATRPKPPGTRIGYIIRPSHDPAPGGGIAIAGDQGWTMYTLDYAGYLGDRDRAGILRTFSPLYYVPRNTVFGAGAVHDYRHVWSQRGIRHWLRQTFGR